MKAESRLSVCPLVGSAVLTLAVFTGCSLITGAVVVAIAVCALPPLEGSVACVVAAGLSFGICGYNWAGMKAELVELNSAVKVLKSNSALAEWTAPVDVCRTIGCVFFGLLLADYAALSYGVRGNALAMLPGLLVAVYGLLTHWGAFLLEVSKLQESWKRF